MKKKVEPLQPYCSECGQKLIHSRDEGAENWCYGDFYPVKYDKYNSSTGERNMVRVFQCPSYHCVSVIAVLFGYKDSHDRRMVKLF